MSEVTGLKVGDRRWYYAGRTDAWVKGEVLLTDKGWALMTYAAVDGECPWGVTRLEGLRSSNPHPLEPDARVVRPKSPDAVGVVKGVDGAAVWVCWTDPEGKAVHEALDASEVERIG